MNPFYSSSTALQAAKKRILSPPPVQVITDEGYENKKKHYEHYVGSWACTMFKQVFTLQNWVITPERTVPHSKKRPDLTVEKVEGGNLKVRLLMELKSNDPKIRFEDAVRQVVAEIAESMENDIECFVIVQCGTRIVFFEYH